MPSLISVRSVVSMMWKFVMKHCGARAVGMSVDEEVRSWCGAIIDCPLLQEVCESCEHGAENAMWSTFRQHPLLCSRCCGACCEQQCCVVVLGNDFVFVLSVVDSWCAFSWCVLCRRSVLNFCPDSCAARSKLLTFGLVRCVPWMAFPSDTCFRIGSGFFSEGWRVSSVFADVVSLVLRNAKFIISRENFVVHSACLFASAIIQWWDRWWVGHGVGVILIHLVWRRLRHLSEKPTRVWTLFSCVHVAASPTTFLRPTLRSKIVWRVPHVFPSTMVRNIARFVKYQVQSIFWEHTLVRHMCCRCRVFTFSFQACLRSWHVLFMIAWSRRPPHQNTPWQTARYMTSIFSVSHPSSCRVGKCQSRGVLIESSRFSFIGKVFRAAFSWFTECEFRSGQDVVSWTILRRVFFRRVVFQTFRRSFISTVVGWSENLGVGSRFVRRNGQRSFVVSCLHVCLVASECCGVCCCARL